MVPSDASPGGLDVLGPFGKRKRSMLGLDDPHSLQEDRLFLTTSVDILGLDSLLAEINMGFQSPNQISAPRSSQRGDDVVLLKNHKTKETKLRKRNLGEKLRRVKAKKPQMENGLEIPYREYWRLSHNETSQASADVTAEPGAILDHLMHEDIINQGDISDTILRHHVAKEEKRDQIELLLLITSLISEAMSAVFEQLQYALLGMVMAILGLILCVIELAYKVRKENATWELRGSLPWIYSRHPHNRLFGSIVEYFGLLAALWQLFHSTIGYLFALKEKNNPVRMTAIMFLFSFCLLMREFMLKYSKMSPRQVMEP